jgi:DNA-binding NtrC family response regulator
VGGTESIRVDVRIVAATHRRLEDEVSAGRFLKDLFYRLNVIRLELPPLRDRKEDIPLLATHFLQRHRSTASSSAKEFEPDAMQALLHYDWPGNVRELENAIKSAIALAAGSVIRLENLPERLVPRLSRRNSGSLINIDQRLPVLTDTLISQVEREYFLRLLTEYRGNVARCARHSGLSRRSVAQKLQKYGLDRLRFKRQAGAPARPLQGGED